jgi:ABC-type transport system, involved in lipoprotein release, permease component
MYSLSKNFVYIFKRFRTAGILNILGLTAAFTGFILILVQISYEINFDKYYPNWKDIYRIRLHITYKEFNEEAIHTLFIRNIADAIIANSPQIDKATIIYTYNKDKYLQIDKGAHKDGYKETIATCYPDITEVFGFEMVEGTRDCLNNPENVIIPKSMAMRMFGNEPSIGKLIHFNDFIQTKAQWGQNNITLTVGGVYKDFPDNVQLDNIIYTAIDPGYAKDKNDRSSNHLLFVTLVNGANVKDLENILLNNTDLIAQEDGIEARLMVENISDIYFSEGEDYGNYGYKTGDKNTSTLLAIIAVLVISIAIINFTNFSTAMAPRRIRSINIRKVLGSSNVSLKVGIVGEAIIISMVSYIIAVAAVYLIIRSDLMPFIDTGISSGSYLNILLVGIFVAILTGCIAGIRPAFYMTSFAPSEAIKGSVVFTSSGFKVRSILVGFQFFIAIALVSATVLMYIQFLYIQNFKLGFDTDQIAVVELNAEVSDKRKTEYIDRLKEHQAIVDIAFSHEKLGASDQYVQYGSMRLNGGEEIYGYMLFPVSWNFLSVMGIELIEGRSYTDQDADSGETSLIINKTTQERTKAKIGDSFTYAWSMHIPQRVVGIVNDIQFSSLRRQMGSTAFTINDKNGHNKLPISYIKISAGADVGDVVKHISNTIASIDPAYPVKIEFYDEIFDKLYQNDTKLANSIYVFSLLAIIIAVMGVFGIVVFDCESRNREIALRKVMGSSVSQVLALFNVQYIRILCVSLIIAIPAVYYLVDKWLQGFAYKTPIHWWTLLIGGIIVLITTTLTVTSQSYRTATDNPSNALKSE